VGSNPIVSATFIDEQPNGQAAGNARLRDISHIRIYANGSPAPGGGEETLAPIPLPAAGWLLLTALGGLGAAGLRGKRRKA
jgi:hypothetical protein